MATKSTVGPNLTPKALMIATGIVVGTKQVFFCTGCETTVLGRGLQVGSRVRHRRYSGRSGPSHKLAVVGLSEAFDRFPDLFARYCRELGYFDGIGLAIELEEVLTLLHPDREAALERWKLQEEQGVVTTLPTRPGLLQ